MNTCKSCRFWQRNDPEQLGSSAHGWCRRYAPSALVSVDYRDQEVTAWPITISADWCGEHEVHDENQRGHESADAMVIRIAKHYEELKRNLQVMKGVVGSIEAKVVQDGDS